MSIALDRPSKLTYEFDLPGGLARLRDAILYICERCESAPHFGLATLGAILWSADFTAFAERARPVTGRTYQRLAHGPAPVEMGSLLNEMEREGHVFIESFQASEYAERRPTAMVKASPHYLTASDMGYLDRAIARMGDAASVIEISHGAAWKSRESGDLMPYESAYLSDDDLSASVRAKLISTGKRLGWRSE